MLRNYFYLVLFCFAGWKGAYAQQMPQTVLFMYNQLIYNPAAAGMHETQFNVNLVDRFQWGGKAGGGPFTNMLWADYRFAGNKTAVGLNLNYDKFGATTALDVAANYAYYVPLSNKVSLSMGLRAGVNSSRLNASDLTAWDANDPVVASSNYKSVSPKIGAGFQLNSKKFYAGISVPDLVMSDKYNIYGNKDRSFMQKRRNFVGLAGYRWKLNDTYDVCPNIRVFYYPGGTVRADFNAIFEITDYFWAGLTYSTSNNHAVMVGTHISSRIRFSYAYEFNTKAGTSIPLSTHEVNLMLNLDDMFKK